jgi:surface antigen
MSPQSYARGLGRRAVMVTAAMAVGALAISAGMPTAAFADPPPWAGVWRVNHGHGHHHHDDDDDDGPRVVYVPQYGADAAAVQQAYQVAPPPQYVQAPVPVARGLPYGFNRGTCDRGMVGNELVGGMLGGVAGGLLGAQIGHGSGRTAATIGTAIVGMLVGGSVGRSMDAVDQGCMAGALAYLPDNKPIAWQGDEGADYRMMPVKSYRVEDGRYCREYTATAVVGGRRQQTYGTACRQPDGQWQIVN